MGGGQFGPSPLLGMKDPWSGSKTDFLPDPFQQDPGRDEHRHQIAVSMVSEGGLTSRIVGFSPPVSVGLVMEPNLVPYRDACHIETWTAWSCTDWSWDPLFPSLGLQVLRCDGLELVDGGNQQLGVIFD